MRMMVMAIAVTGLALISSAGHARYLSDYSGGSSSANGAVSSNFNNGGGSFGGGSLRGGNYGSSRVSVPTNVSIQRPHRGAHERKLRREAEMERLKDIIYSTPPCGTYLRNPSHCKRGF